MTCTDTRLTVATSEDVRPVRVVLVDDDEIIMQGLRGMLAPYRDRVEVVGWVPVSEDVLAGVTQLNADVALLDVEFQGVSGLDVAARLVADKPELRVVIFTDDGDERRLFDALRLGVSGYLLKSLGGASLADHLVRVRDGQTVVDPTLATHIAMRAADLGAHAGWPGKRAGLSKRESEVLHLLVDGLSNRLIADQLIIGEETVKTHLRSIYRKLGVSDRAQAVATALRQGIF